MLGEQENKQNPFLEIKKDIIFCLFRWARPDLSPQSGLAVMEVELPTGFMIVRPTLDIMLANQPRMKWNLFETSVNKLFMFFENVSFNVSTEYLYIFFIKLCYIQRNVQRFYLLVICRGPLILLSIVSLELIGFSCQQFFFL